MPVAVMQPALSANADYTVGDAVYVNGLTIEWDDTVHFFGRDAAKTPVNRGAVSHYDTSIIPLGATVDSAKVEVKASHADDTDFSSNLTIDVLATSGGSWDQRLNQTDEAFHLGPEFIYYPNVAPYPGLTSAWASGRRSGNNQTISMPMNIAYGVGSIAQAWTCNAAGDGDALVAHYFHLLRTGSLSNTDVFCRLYEASGSAGSYTKGTLLDTSASRSASLINSSSINAFWFVPGSTVTLSEGTVYISELVFSGTDTGSPNIKVGVLTTAGGTSDNAVVYARQTPAPARVVQGFGGYTKWITGSSIKDASGIGTTDTLTGTGVPDFDSGTVYGFGSGTSAGTHTGLTNFESNVQAALNARTSTRDWIGVRFQDFSGTTNGAQRRFHSSKSSTETISGYKGMVLTVEFTLPSNFVAKPPPTIRSGVSFRPMNKSSLEYDSLSENTFRRDVEDSLALISAKLSDASAAHGREASCASKKERLLPRVGVKTFG
jgi:hypothetical protein